MATLFEGGLIAFLQPLFTFIFVFTILFAVLEKTKILGGNKGSHSLVALVIAMLVMLTPGVAEVLNIFTPWFVVFIIFLIFLALIFMAVGVSGDKVTAAFTQDWVAYLIGIIAIFGIFGFAFSKVFGPVLSGATGAPGAEEGFGSTLVTIIVNPKVLGALFILVMASQMVRLLSGQSKSS
ncbi:hypothetical protein J4430_01400 [Candidatus Woesearchaeota archaeon]|nr:hypothetical protein [Candidatus Woesearchaeota archaeon]